MTGFIDKNKDPIYQDFMRLLYNRSEFTPLVSHHMTNRPTLSHSKHALLQEQWPEGAKAVTEVTKRPKSAGTTFKESMIALVDNLKTKDPFYVRCIKPNETKSAMKFDDERCLHQVGVVCGCGLGECIVKLFAGELFGSVGELESEKSRIC